MSQIKEEVQLILYDYKIEETTNDIGTLIQYAKQNNLDYCEEMDNNYILDYKGYSFTIRKDNLEIIDTKKTVVRPKITFQDNISDTELIINANILYNNGNKIQGHKYFIYEGDNLIASSEMTGENWKVSNLVAGNTYSIYVETYDINGNNVKSPKIEYKKLNVYKWSKHSTEIGKIYSYRLIQSDVKGSYSVDGMSVARGAVSSIENQFNPSTGLWTYDIGNIQRDSLGRYISPQGYDGYSNYGVGQTTDTLWYVKTFGGEYAVRNITYDIYQSYAVDSYKIGTTDYGYVTSNDENAYPNNGEKEENGVVYWYVKQ